VALRGDKFPISPISSSLISPRILVPDASSNPHLSFQNWFKIHPAHSGQVFVSLADGTEEAISIQYNGDSSGWTPALLPLGKYGGKIVRFKFSFGSYVDSTWPGWFIDDVRVIPPVHNARPQFSTVKPQLAHALEKLEFVVKETDADSGESIEYSMDTNSAPVTAQFDAPSGTFSWTPTVAESSAPGYYLTFYATDAGQPPLRDVLVVPVLPSVPDPAATGQAGGIAPSLILADRLSYEGWALRLVGGLIGFDYTLESSHDLNLPWTVVVRNLALSQKGQMPRLVTPVAIPGEGQLFYRLRADLSAGQ
jgi:hypothetical protein